MQTTILIPAYRPDEHLIRLAEALTGQYGLRCVIVDDGSGPEFRELFDEAAMTGSTILAHSSNHGKGAAIKTGIAWIRREYPDTAYIITADADGQHLPEDIARLAKVAMENETLSPLILGVRCFLLPQVPLRSRLGNRFSSFYFRLSTGVRCPDTQTGLRAIPRRLFALALATPGERYEFEMQFLMAAAREGALTYVPITTVYETGNKSSHFNTVRDSVRIYKTPLKYVGSSLICAAADLLVFAVLTRILGSGAGFVWAATVLARILSGCLNFMLNRSWSFSGNRASEGNAARQAVRYGILFVAIMCASALCVSMLSALPIPLVLTKAVVDTALSVISYLAQLNWVFKRPEGLPAGRRSRLLYTEKADFH